MVDMPSRARFPSYYSRFPLFAGSVRLVVNRGPAAVQPSVHKAEDGLTFAKERELRILAAHVEETVLPRQVAGELALVVLPLPRRGASSAASGAANSAALTLEGGARGHRLLRGLLVITR